MWYVGCRRLWEARIDIANCAVENQARVLPIGVHDIEFADGDAVGPFLLGLLGCEVCFDDPALLDFFVQEGVDCGGVCLGGFPVGKAKFQGQVVEVDVGVFGRRPLVAAGQGAKNTCEDPLLKEL